MAGRTPKPPTLKLLQGRSPGRDSGGREVVPPPPFVRLAPEPPAMLEGEALAEWHRVVPELERLQLLKTTDGGSLAAYCMAWARFVEASAIVKAEGMVLHDDKQGRAQRHPALLTAEAASKEIRAWAVQFALTPSAEGKLVGGKKDDDAGKANPFANVG